MSDSIILNSIRIIYALGELGFTHFKFEDGNVYINGQLKHSVMPGIRVALRDAEVSFTGYELNDIILILAHAGADLESQDCIPDCLKDRGSMTIKNPKSPSLHHEGDPGRFGKNSHFERAN